MPELLPWALWWRVTSTSLLRTPISALCICDLVLLVMAVVEVGDVDWPLNGELCFTAQVSSSQIPVEICDHFKERTLNGVWDSQRSKASFESSFCFHFTPSLSWTKMGSDDMPHTHNLTRAMTLQSLRMTYFTATAIFKEVIIKPSTRGHTVSECRTGQNQARAQIQTADGNMACREISAAALLLGKWH